MIPSIEQLHQLDYFSALDLHFARVMGRLANETDGAVLLAAALASRFTGRGHVCVDLKNISGTRIRLPESREELSLRWPRAGEWIAAVAASPLTGRGDRPTPLVLGADHRLYLTRYWHYQQTLVAALRQRAGATPPAVDAELLSNGLERLFGPDAADPPDGQRMAAATAVAHRLAVVSGGPGTGKTTTVVKILALIVEQALANGGVPPDIVLAAPTGKAAARVKAAVASAKQDGQLACDDRVKAAIPSEAATLHRVLGVQRRDPTRFRHDAQNPLPADVVVVDESSMVDLALMTKLAMAVRDSARLILLGDKDQLASVEAGAVFGDICRSEEIPGDRQKNPEKIDRCIVHLTRNYRFGSRSGIGALTRAVNQGDSRAAIDILDDPARPDAVLETPGDPRGLARALAPWVHRFYRPLLNAHDPVEGLALLERFRILCAHRSGPLGADGVNPVVTALLNSQTAVGSPWYAGRPVMVTANHYALGLFNGDVGFTAPTDDDRRNLAVWFTGSQTDLRCLSPARLPDHETVYAMTVHKAQGSEFEHVVLILPERRTTVVTRELLYTAISRAKKSITILGTRAVIEEAVQTPVARESGLGTQLRTPR